MVIEHRLHILEPFQFGSALVIVEPASEQHQCCHYQATNGSDIKLECICKTSCTPNVEQARGNLNAVEAAADISVQNLLTNNRPNNLGARLNPSGIREPSFIVGKPSAMEIHATQPDKDDGQVAKVSTEDLPRDIF